MFALHGAQAAEPTFTEGFRETLRALGVTALQVNVDDDAVAPAMRLGTGDPVVAVLSVWAPDKTDASAFAPIVAAIAEASGEAAPHGWLVEETVRLDPAPVPDGERSDVLANVALLRRPAEMSHGDYLAYWRLHHTAIAIRTQNTSAYVQNAVVAPLTDGSPAVAALVEEHFPMAAMTDLHEFYGSRGDDVELQRRMSELMASVERFGAAQDIDLVPSSRYSWRW